MLTCTWLKCVGGERNTRQERNCRESDDNEAPILGNCCHMVDKRLACGDHLTSLLFPPFSEDPSLEWTQIFVDRKVMQNFKSLSALVPDKAAMSNGMTENDLTSWLDSNTCTLEAIGWNIVERHVLEMPLQTFDQYPLPEVGQLETAVISGDMTSVRYILQQWHARPKEKQISKDLFTSSYKFAMGDVSIASYLIKQGISINESHFKLAMKKRSFQFLECFLDHGFDINRPRSYIDPAPLADTFDDEKMTRWFLDHGADPNAETENGTTPLSRAVLYAPFDIIALLFDHGGPDSINHGQLLHHAVYRESLDHLGVLQYLLRKGALRNINQLKYQDRMGLFEVENLIIDCETPLHEAARGGRLDVVKLLVAQGANPLIQDGKGRLAVELAHKTCHSQVVEYLAPLSNHIELWLITLSDYTYSNETPILPNIVYPTSRLGAIDHGHMIFPSWSRCSHHWFQPTLAPFHLGIHAHSPPHTPTQTSMRDEFPLLTGSVITKTRNIIAAFWYKVKKWCSGLTSTIFSYWWFISRAMSCFISLSRSDSKWAGSRSVSL